MAASPPPAKALSAGGDARISLFLDTDLGTHLALNVAADSTIRGLKSQVATEHADAFPDLGTVVVKSFQVRRKGAMYHLSDSMPVRSAFAKVKAGYFLHVKMVAAETDTRYSRDEGRGKSSDKLPPMLKGGEDAGAWVTVHAHDAHPSSSLQQNTERKSTTFCVATDVQTVSVPVIDKSESDKQGQKHKDQTEGVYVNSTSVANINVLTNQSNVTLAGKEVHAREEDILHSVGDRELGFVSSNKQMGMKEDMSAELHALDDLSQEKDCKKARVTGSFDMSAIDPTRETNDSKTTDVENFDKLLLETITTSCEVISNTSLQQQVDGNVKEDSIQLEIPSLTGKNKKRKIKSKDVSAPKMIESSTGAVEVPKDTGEDLLQENKGLEGDGASEVEMTCRDKTKVIPPDMLLLPSQLNGVSQVTKLVQLGTDAQATCDLAADQSNIYLVHEEYRNPIGRDLGISTCKVVDGEEKSAKGTNDGDHDESAVDLGNTEKGSKRGNVLETLDNISQEVNCKQSKKVTSVGLTSMDTDEAKNQCGYDKKADKSDIIPTQQEIVNDPSKRQIASNVQQGIENPNGDVKRKKRRRQHPESSKDDPTREAAESSGFIMNASSTQNTSSCCLDANQITLGNIGEETADEKDQCLREKVIELVVCTQGVSVNDPSNVQQGDSDVKKNPDGDGKRKKKKKRCLGSSMDDPTQDVTKSSGLITNGSSIQNISADPLNAEQTTPGMAGETTESECKKVDETVDLATTNVINEVLADLQKKSKRSSKAQAPKIEEVDHSTHGHENQFANDNQDKHVSDIGVTNNIKNTVGAPRESSLVHKDDTTVTCGKPNARKGRKKSSKTELRSQDTNLGHGSDADLMNCVARQGAIIPEGFSDAVQPNDHAAVRPGNEKINFIDHFSPSVMNDPSDYAQNDDETIREVKAKKKSKRKADTHSQHAGSTEPNDLPESLVHTAKTSLADHFGTGNVGVPSVSAENVNREDGNVKKAKGKNKRKGKQDLIKPESLNPNGGDQDTGNCTQDLMHSDVQEGRMEQCNAKENNDKVIHNDSMLQQETVDATHDSTLEKKVPQSLFGADGQTDLPIGKDHAPKNKEQRNSTSQTKRHAMRPEASNESANGTPAIKRVRVAVRKVPRKMYEHAKDKSKKDNIKRGTGTIFGDDVSESSDEVLNTMSAKAAMGNSSSTSADSALYESDVPDDDGIASLSQKSDILSVLRGSTSYKKARLKPTELFDDTEVPDSQPPI
ncbi:uncharacterized protein [Lolium perenne]|uniref:uncharacterized protein isoform X2 n=1 Tax=Lolium perenne TaxID=4522 RepID=UPI0021F594C7|nr:uncharacterized protein LOC127335310 isoform X2 [Lolium perenne]